MLQKIFENLTVVSQAPSDAKGNSRWVCTCTCGNTVTAYGFKLRSGRKRSCGCTGIRANEELQRIAISERRDYTHSSYDAMMGRCYDPRYPAYARYGQKGIRVHDRWRFGENGKTGWACFYEDMGPRPQGLTLDRYDPYGMYCKANCRWATRKEQANENKRAK